MTTTLTAPETAHGLETIRERHVTEQEARAVAEASEQDEPRLTPVLVHLSGSRRGQSLPVSGNEIKIGTGAEMDLRLPLDTEPLPAPHHATLRCRGTTYEVMAEGDGEVWVNGEQVRRFTLASGDVLEIGRDGAVLRYRVYDAGVAPYKTMTEVFSDCLDCARNSDRGPVGKAAMVLTDLPKQLATQTTRTFRVGVLTVLILLGSGTVLLARRSAQLEQQLAEEMTRVEGLAELLERTRAQVPTSDDLGDLFAELQSSLSTARDRLDALEERSGAEARVIRMASRSTVFVQGSYGFVHPESSRPLRLVLGPGGQPIRNAAGEPAISVDGEGPPLEILLTGTAFVVSPDGLVLTNRHVSRPWEFNPAGRAMLAQSFEGRMTRFVGYLPGVAEGFDLELVSASDEADLALLCCVVSDEADYLPLAEVPPEPGEAVLVLGFPLGVRALMARTNPEFVQGLRDAGITDFWEVAVRLSRAGHVTPLATRGIVGQVTSQNVVYDAETTSGGSGGPVLSLDGQVVAINAAILPEFGGSNLGVPAARARELLSAVRQLP